MKSETQLRREKDNRTFALIIGAGYIVVIGLVMTLWSIALDAPSMVPQMSKQGERNLRGAARNHAEGTLK